VVFGGYDNRLYCLSAADGNLLWQVQTRGYVHASPAVVDSAVITAGCDGMLRLVDLAQGGELATIGLDSYVAASCAVSDGHAYVGTFAEEVVSIDLADGEVAWRYRHPDRNFPFYSSAAIAQDLIIVGGRDKMLHAIDRQSGESRWVFAAGARIESSPVIAGQRVFFATASGRIHAIDLDSGEVGWSFDTGSSIAASPAVANRRLVIGDLDGTLYCFAGGTE
jgi:outer membrane protein assembly factor BamB